MYLYDGETPVGTFGAVTVSPDGHSVHLDRFVPSAVWMRQGWASRKIVLVEVIAFLVEQFVTVTNIRVSLNSPVGRHDDLLKVARDRAQILHQIGGRQIDIIPDFAPSNRGHFTVSGVWRRNPQSLKALNDVLRHERQEHRFQRTTVATARGRLVKLGKRIRDLILGSTEKPI